MANTHTYDLDLSWDLAGKGPVVNYADYSRAWTAEVVGKPVLAGSADPHYKGDPAAWNPEELLVASLSSCHMLSYLALAAMKKVVIHSYADAAHGVMQMQDGKMRITNVTLRPKVGVAAGTDLELAKKLHDDAHHQCFIANSVTVEIAVEPEFFEV